MCVQGTILLQIGFVVFLYEIDYIFSWTSTHRQSEVLSRVQGLLIANYDLKISYEDIYLGLDWVPPLMKHKEI